MSDTKPTAWGIEIIGELADVGLYKQQMELEFHRRQEKYPDPTRKFVELYTADQLRAAKVEVLRDAAEKWNSLDENNSYKFFCRMADEIKKGEAE